jgi:hypothetical protein
MSAMVFSRQTCDSYTQLKAAAIKDFLGGQPESVRSTVLTKLQVTTIVRGINDGSWHNTGHHFNFFFALADKQLCRLISTENHAFLQNSSESLIAREVHQPVQTVTIMHTTTACSANIQLLHQVAALLRRELGSRGGEEMAGGRTTSPISNRKNRGDDRVSEMLASLTMSAAACRLHAGCISHVLTECRARAVDGQNYFGGEGGCRGDRERRRQRERGVTPAATSVSNSVMIGFHSLIFFSSGGRRPQERQIKEKECATACSTGDCCRGDVTCGV